MYTWHIYSLFFTVLLYQNHVFIRTILDYPFMWAVIKLFFSSTIDTFTPRQNLTQILGIITSTMKCVYFSLYLIFPIGRVPKINFLRKKESVLSVPVELKLRLHTTHPPHFLYGKRSSQYLLLHQKSSAWVVRRRRYGHFTMEQTKNKMTISPPTHNPHTWFLVQ